MKHVKLGHISASEERASPVPHSLLVTIRVCRHGWMPDIHLLVKPKCKQSVGGCDGGGGCCSGDEFCGGVFP